MGVCVVIQSLGIVSTGSDVTPAAVNWTDITSFSSPATTNTVSITGINTPVTFRAAWTGNIKGRWIKNGAEQPSGASPRDVTINNNTTLAFRLTLETEPGAASGAVTVTNLTDGGAAVDTFAYYVEDTGTA